jgi:succinyl-CoA synthetase alpha subunit
MREPSSPVEKVLLFNLARYLIWISSMKNFKFNFSGTAAAKIAAMKAAGIHVTNSPAEMGKTILRAIINK